MKNAVIVKCKGEAHCNPFIDNCERCMPWWLMIPVCPDDGTKLRPSPDRNPSGKGYCPNCRRRFAVPPRMARRAAVDGSP